jgi:hypothetical protein
MKLAAVSREVERAAKDDNLSLATDQVDLLLPLFIETKVAIDEYLRNIAVAKSQ